MNPRLPALAAALALATGLASLPASAASPEKLRVFVPVLPYEYLFERIGGDWIEVKAIVQEGGDCHNYSPSPRQIAAISKANLLFSGGLSFESNFFVAVGDGINSPKEIDLLEGLELLEGSCGECESAKAQGKEAAEHKHDHEDLMDAHVWLSPRVLLHQAERVAAILKERTPPAADAAIDANFASLKAELEALDKELAETLEPKKGSAFYVYHAAFAYFARDYGLEQKAIEMGNRRPSPKQIAEIAKQAREDGVKAIFVQPQFDQSSAVSLAETIGGRVQTLDPLEKDVVANLRTIARTIASIE
jgi:zinc transport system substrate-binding protein